MGRSVSGSRGPGGSSREASGKLVCFLAKYRSKHTAVFWVHGSPNIAGRGGGGNTAPALDVMGFSLSCSHTLQCDNVFSIYIVSDTEVNLNMTESAQDDCVVSKQILHHLPEGTWSLWILLSSGFLNQSPMETQE